MEEEIKAGDIVALNSGSPSMTVTKVENGIVWCTWSNQAPAMGFGTASFPTPCLRVERRAPN